MKNVIWIYTLILLSSCATQDHFVKEDTYNEPDRIADSNISQEVYLLGNLNINDEHHESIVLNYIHDQLDENDTNQSVVFLGNTLDTERNEFNNSNKILKSVVKNCPNTYFIPGNQEWDNGHSYTLDALRRSEEDLDKLVNTTETLSPKDGCGEPKVIELGERLLLLLIDSQWVLQSDFSGERKRSGCSIDNELELITRIQTILSKNKNKNIIIASHHPVWTNSKTGGNYSLKDHILPLPLIGSIITGVKKIGGIDQHFGNPQYEAYRAALNLALSNFEGIVVASSHDHNLQYIQKNKNHFVVSGSSTNVEFLQKGGQLEYGTMRNGFAKLIQTKDLQLWIEYYTLDPNSKRIECSFRKKIFQKEIIDFKDDNLFKNSNNIPNSVTTNASDVYSKRILGMGKGYRKEWGTKIQVDVLLLDEFEGGLKPVQQGGGFQTKSLRLENPDGVQWVVRSVDKDVSKVVPPALRGTLAESLVQDGIAAAHPYGAMVIPPLAEAANIYHANPKFVWLPHQKALGEYDTDFANRLYLFEERPGGNVSFHKDYGGTDKTVNTPSLIKKLIKNHHHKVDQHYVLRARIFDLLIGDWDRHDDQWRWGIYEGEDEKKLYRAIPRDRDQVFFNNDGFLNYIASRPYFNPGLRRFDDEIDFIFGLAYNARYFDRHFLSEMTKNDFLETAHFLQDHITDDVIRNALASWPNKIYNINGDRIQKKLIKRRDDLIKYSAQFYDYLSKEVTAIGTNGKNIFEVKCLKNNELDVKVYHLEDNGKHLIWSRKLKGHETNELRLFGLKKKDEFNFEGDEESSIKVILVGGTGDDIINNQAPNLKIVAYDQQDNIKLGGYKVKEKFNDRPDVHEFNRRDWLPDRTLTFPMLGFYTDEGLGLSINHWELRQAFRKRPYKASHNLSGSFFFRNRALIGTYRGHWPELLGYRWDLQLSALASGPAFTQFYYGITNDYQNFEDIFPNEPDANSSVFHVVRGVHIDINPEIIKRFRYNRSLTFNPSFEYLDFSNQDIEGRSTFVFRQEAKLDSTAFGEKYYVGFGINYNDNRINNLSIPTRGYNFNIGADYKLNTSNTNYSNITLSSNLEIYLPLNISQSIVFASNIGGAYTLGDAEFFHSNYLANQSRLRGYRINRFAGNAIFYHANDLRIKLLQGQGRLKTGLGVFASFDYGRSFVESEQSEDWHTSYGTGIFVTPLKLLGFKIGYYFAKDDGQWTIGSRLRF